MEVVEVVVVVVVVVIVVVEVVPCCILRERKFDVLLLICTIQSS